MKHLDQKLTIGLSLLGLLLSPLALTAEPYRLEPSTPLDVYLNGQGNLRAEVGDASFEWFAPAELTNIHQ